MTCPFESTATGRCFCGKKLSGRQTKFCSRICARRMTAEHRWTQAKAAAKAMATWFQCAECKDFFRVVEVDHIIPIKGKHKQWGCWHHSSGLRVLCVGCHLIKTNEDRLKGWT